MLTSVRISCSRSFILACLIFKTASTNAFPANPWFFPKKSSSFAAFNPFWLYGHSFSLVPLSIRTRLTEPVLWKSLIIRFSEVMMPVVFHLYISLKLKSFLMRHLPTPLQIFIIRLCSSFCLRSVRLLASSKIRGMLFSTARMPSTAFPVLSTLSINSSAFVYPAQMVQAILFVTDFPPREGPYKLQTNPSRFNSPTSTAEKFAAIRKLNIGMPISRNSHTF